MSFTDPFPYVHDVRLRNELMRRYGIIDTEKQDTIEGTTANASIKWDGSAWVENDELLQTSAALDTRVPVLTIGDPNASGGEGAQINLRDQNGGTTDQLTIDINSLGDSRIFQKGDGDLWLGNLTGGTGDLRFYTNGTAKMYLLNNGRVGIGTASPEQLLHILGDGARIRLRTNTATPAQIQLVDSADSAVLTLTSSGNFALFNNNAADGFLFRQGATENMRIASNGNVGIGASNPTYKVALGQDAGDAFALGSGGGFSFDGVTVPDYGITYTAPSGEFNTVLSGFSNIKFTANRTEMMRVTSAGHVGINTSTPRYLIEVATDANADGIVIHRDDSTAGTYASLFFETRLGDASNPKAGIFSIANGGSWGRAEAITFNLCPTNDAVIVGTADEVMRIQENGNVGIGDTNPSDRLSIGCDDGDGISISGGAGGFGESSRLKVQGRAEFGYDGVDSTVYISDAGSTKPIKFEVTAGEAMRITTGKFVGIGTSNPLSTLHVKGPNAIISVQDDAGTLAQMEWLDSSNNVLMNMRSGGTSFVTDLEAGGDWIYRVSGVEAMRINGATGNVAIGTATASSVDRLTLDMGDATTGGILLETGNFTDQGSSITWARSAGDGGGKFAEISVNRDGAAAARNTGIVFKTTTNWSTTDPTETMRLSYEGLLVGGRRAQYLGNRSATESTGALAAGNTYYVNWNSDANIDTTYFTHSTSTNPSRITVVEAGRYSVKAVVGVANTGGARTQLSCQVRINGTTTITLGQIFAYNRGSVFGRLSPAYDYELDLGAGDYIEIGVFVEADDATYTYTIQSDSSYVNVKKLT